MMSQIQTVLRADALPDRLLAGFSEVVTNHRPLTGRARYARGTVVGFIAETGAMTICTTDATDGSQNPAGILAADYDCTKADIPRAAVFERGEFNARALVLADGITADDVHEPLRERGISLLVVVSPGGAIL